MLDSPIAFFPGPADHTTFIEGASPRTMERYTLSLTVAKV
jgi:hypothetical protein